MATDRVIAEALPERARAILGQLWVAGHAGYAVGGGVRDVLLGRPLHDIDLATDARPDRLLALFPGGHLVGAYGTVAVDDVEVTTFRRDHTYRDHRRPDAVTWTDDLSEDLARRDFTINALAWGGPAGSTTHGTATLVDPMGGLPDIAARRLRAVGDPDARFAEDALRLLRGARFTATLDLTIEPATFAAMRRHGQDARWLSAERVRAELRRMLMEAAPSRSLRILDDIGSLAAVLPEVTAQHGLAQAKIAGHDLFDHSMATADAAASLPGASERLVLAALLHDVGKPGTFADGHFIRHPVEGARLATIALQRLRCPNGLTADVGALIREHMFQYTPDWTDAAVRRFLRRVGLERIDDLLRLRQADNLGSGQAADPADLIELRARLDRERVAGSPLSLGDLSIDGNDILAAVDRPPGPWVGVLLDRLLDSVVNDPERNRPAVLLADVRRWAADADPGRASVSS